ncbi:hypothetical protein FQA39_LY18923 [Lamprigera yunnana]|nr:hypothetical protein FQA39_LY18923 [Lamprigera yunnana]
MIRAFFALGAGGGTPDAAALSIGISEAVDQHALGLAADAKKALLIKLVYLNKIVTDSKKDAEVLFSQQQKALTLLLKEQFSPDLAIQFLTKAIEKAEKKGVPRHITNYTLGDAYRLKRAQEHSFSIKHPEGKVSLILLKALLNSEQKKMLGTGREKLLLAAQRQEGLRQTILEALDENKVLAHWST